MAFPRRLGCGLAAAACVARTPAAGAAAADDVSSSFADGEPAWANAALPTAKQVTKLREVERRHGTSRFLGGVVAVGRAWLSIRPGWVISRISDVHHITPNCLSRQVAAQSSGRLATMGGPFVSQGRLIADRQNLKLSQASSDNSCKAK